MGTKRFDTIGDCLRHGVTVEGRCRSCGHRGPLFLPRLMMHARRCNMTGGGHPIKCSVCGGRDCEVRPSGYRGDR